ncbi:MAG: DUF4252 domain-containing protein [Niabella sp.]
MKYILSVLFILTVGIANAQLSKLDAIFDKYQEAKGVTSIKIAKPMFKMLNSLNIEDEDLKRIRPLTQSINSIKILIIEDSMPGISNSILDAIKKLNYEELMTVNSNDSKIKFLATPSSGNTVSNLVLSVLSGKQNILMYLDGKLNLDDVSKLVNDSK